MTLFVRRGFLFPARSSSAPVEEHRKPVNDRFYSSKAAIAVDQLSELIRRPGDVFGPQVNGASESATRTETETYRMESTPDLLSPTPLKPEAIAAALSTLPGWEQHGVTITKKWRFKTYLAGIDFVTQVARAAEALDHHPDLLVGWRKVQATLSTHVANGLTEYDIELARQIDKAFESFAG